MAIKVSLNLKKRADRVGVESTKEVSSKSVNPPLIRGEKSNFLETWFMYEVERL